MATLCERIEELCNERGISGYRLCKELGISLNTLTELRKGRRTGMSAKNADKIAAYFDVSVAYLLGTENERKNKPAITENGELTELQKLAVEKILTLSEERLRALIAFMGE